MIERIGFERWDQSPSRQIGWRALLAAWAVVLMLGLLVAGAKAMNRHNLISHPDAHLAGAVIPQRDPCIELGVPSAPGPDGCQTALQSQELGAYW